MLESNPSDNRTLLYLDDISPGQRFTTQEQQITEADILAFARAFDPQPFHLDPAAAKNSVFGGLAASGWHTAAFTMRLLLGSGARIAGGMVGAGAEINWPRPTRPGDMLHVETEVLEVTPSRTKPDRGMVKMLNLTKNQRGEVVQEFTGKLIVPRRHPG